MLSPKRAAMADHERRHVAQLKQELEQERSLRKQFHRDKVDTSSYTFSSS